MAKCGDKNIPDIEEFFESFESLPFDKIVPVVIELLSSSLGSIKKK